MHSTKISVYFSMNEIYVCVEIPIITTLYASPTDAHLSMSYNWPSVHMWYDNYIKTHECILTNNE